MAPPVLSVLKQPIAHKQAEVLRVILRQRFLTVCQMETGIGKIVLAIINKGVDVPAFFFRLHHIRGVQVVGLYCPGFASAGVGIEIAFAMLKNGLHIGRGDRIPDFTLGGAVLGNGEIGIACHIRSIGVDDFVIIDASKGKNWAIRSSASVMPSLSA